MRLYTVHHEIRIRTNDGKSGSCKHDLRPNGGAVLWLGALLGVACHGKHLRIPRFWMNQSLGSEFSGCSLMGSIMPHILTLQSPLLCCVYIVHKDCL